MIILFTGAVLITVVVTYLFLVNPWIDYSRKEEMKPFESVYIAHRGFFIPGVRPENSLSAFKSAVDHLYGIELDVQLTEDDRLVVFHDETTDRMCGQHGKVANMSYAELQEMRLDGTDETIPLFSEVLDVVKGKVPMIIEVKPEGRCVLAAKKLMEILAGYAGTYCVESFNPLVLEWLRKNHQDVIRGQLASNFFRDDGVNGLLNRFVLTNLLLNFRGRPDFIAYNHRYVNQFTYLLVRKLFNPVNVAWTIKCQTELEEARKTFTVFIFDSFVPDSKLALDAIVTR